MKAVWDAFANFAFANGNANPSGCAKTRTLEESMSSMQDVVLVLLLRSTVLSRAGVVVMINGSLIYE